MKLTCFMVGSIRVLVHMSTRYRNRRPKMFLMMEEIPTVTAVRFWVLLTHSVPTLYFGLMKQSYRVSPDSANWRISLASSPPVKVFGEAHSPTPENSRVD